MNSENKPTKIRNNPQLVSVNKPTKIRNNPWYFWLKTNEFSQPSF